MAPQKKATKKTADTINTKLQLGAFSSAITSYFITSSPSLFFFPSFSVV